MRGARSPWPGASPGTSAWVSARTGRGLSWRVDQGTIPSSSISSEPVRKVRIVSEEISQIVTRVWTEHIGIPEEWGPEQTATFVRGEAERMTNQITVMSAEAQEVAIADWRARHDGQVPDAMTHIGLIQAAARAQCQEIVLSQELYEMVPVAEEDRELTPREQQAANERFEEAEEREWAAAQSDPNRWRTVYAPEPSEQTDEAVAMIWPERSIMFRVVAAKLWEVRVIDKLPLPQIMTAQTARLKDRITPVVSADRRCGCRRCLGTGTRTIRQSTVALLRRRRRSPSRSG